jgi:hypothetical protein
MAFVCEIAEKGLNFCLSLLNESNEVQRSQLTNPENIFIRQQKRFNEMKCEVRWQGHVGWLIGCDSCITLHQLMTRSGGEFSLLEESTVKSYLQHVRAGAI